MMIRESQTLSEKAEAALQQAALLVIERARQTDTPVIVWENGRIREIAGKELEQWERRNRGSESAS